MIVERLIRSMDGGAAEKSLGQIDVDWKKLVDKKASDEYIN